MEDVCSLAHGVLNLKLLDADKCARQMTILQYAPNSFPAACIEDIPSPGVLIASSSVLCMAC